MITEIEAIELARHVLYLEEDAGYDTIIDRLHEAFEIDLINFSHIAHRLMQLTVPQLSPLTKTWNIGFVDNNEKCFICKEKYRGGTE